MSVQNKSLQSTILWLNLIVMFIHHDVLAFHLDKSRVYLFDEVETDFGYNFSENKSSLTISPSSEKANNVEGKFDSSSNFTKLPLENHTINFVPHHPIGEIQYKADENTSVATSIKQFTTPKFEDVMDPQFVESEMTRYFFLRAISNLIEHIMSALFAVEDLQQVTESPFFDYDLSPSHNLSKRDADPESMLKINNEDLNVNHTLELKNADTNTSSVENNINDSNSNSSHFTGGKNSLNTLISLSFANESNLMSINETLSQSLTYPKNMFTNLSNDDTEVNSTKGKEKNENLTKIVKSDNFKVLSDGSGPNKMELLTNQAEKPKSIDAGVQPFHYRDGSLLLNDEVENKKDSQFYGEVFPVEDHNEFNEHLKDDDHNNNTSLLATALICTTVFLLLLLGVLALAGGYLYRRHQPDSGNQSASNSQSVVA